MTAFAVLVLVWGGCFLFSSWGLALVAPGQLAVLRVAAGLGPVLLFALATRALAWRHLRHAHHVVVMSVLTVSVHYLLFAVGTARLPSGIAGAIAGTIPLFSVALAGLALREERLDRARVAAVLAGLAGVLVLARPWAGGSVDGAGVAAVLGGSALLGASFVYARRFLVGLDVPAAAWTTYQMGLGLLTLLLVVDLGGTAAIATDARALVGVVLGLGVLGTGVAFLLFYVVVARLGAVTAASSTYVPPVIALALGCLVNGEAARATDALGVALVLAGVLGAARRAPAGTSSASTGPEAVAAPSDEGERGRRRAGTVSSPLRVRRPGAASSAA